MTITSKIYATETALMAEFYNEWDLFKLAYFHEYSKNYYTKECGNIIFKPSNTTQTTSMRVLLHPCDMLNVWECFKTVLLSTNHIFSCVTTFWK